MYKSFLKLAMGTTLMTSLVVNPTIASAQMAPGTHASAPAAAQSSSQSAPGSDYIAVARDDLTGGLRAVRTGDNSRALISFADFMRQFPDQGEAKYNEIRKENSESCAETGGVVRESLAISAEAHRIDGKLFDLDPMLVRLGRKQNAAANLNMGAAVVSTGALCLLSAGLYCLAAGASGLGSIFQTSAHKKTQKVDREMRFISVDQSRLQIRGMLLTMRANILWANTMQDYCLKVFPGQTLGAGPVSPLAVYTTGQARSVEEGR